MLCEATAALAVVHALLEKRCGGSIGVLAMLTPLVASVVASVPVRVEAVVAVVVVVLAVLEAA